MTDIDIDFIDPNPYQPREREDAEHVKKIALSIAADGLLQVPVGRWVHPSAKTLPKIYGYEPQDYAALMIATGWRVQLAFGHTRLAAYKWLRDVKDVSNITGDFTRMPVVIRPLSDEEMFRHGISENVARKDLLPLEEAKAMLRYRDEFGKSSGEIGDLFGLSDSTVRGKMRLLQLPAELQGELAGVRENTLRELLFMFELPEEIRLRAEGHYEQFIKPSLIISAAVQGIGSEEINKRVTKLATYWSRELNGEWKHDREDWPALMHILGACKGCQFRLTRDKVTYCLKTICFEGKKKAVQNEYLEQASEVCGYPILEGKERGDVTEFEYSNREEPLKVARSAGCENLRLVYTEPRRWDNGEKHDRVEGFPQATIVCQKRNGFCTCTKATEVGVNIAQRAEVKRQEMGEEAPAVSLTADDLKDIAREAKQQKRQNAEEVRAMRDDLAKQIAAAMTSDNPAIWHQIILRFDWGMANKCKEENWGENWYAYAEMLRMELARRMTDQIYDTQYSDPDPKRAMQLFNAFLKSARLPELSTVSTETPESEKA